MDFTKIFKMQKALDKAILKEHNITEDVTDKKVLALIVEVGEFANEIKPFKFWKKDKNIDRDKVVEEFVDGIHFLSSLANDVGLEPDIGVRLYIDDQTQQLLITYETMIKLYTRISKERVKEAFEWYMGVAKLVGITDEEIEEFYVDKNKVNYERIANNY